MAMERGEVVSLIEAFDAEVNNGGFDQFFFNSLSDNTAEIIQALETVGAIKTAAILRRAAAKFPGEMPPKDWSSRQDLLVEQVSPEADAFQELDKEFYSAPEDLSDLLQTYKSR
jgi:uncharacterized protein DUF4375